MSDPRPGRAKAVLFAAATLCAASAMLVTACNQAPAQSSTETSAREESSGSSAPAVNPLLASSPSATPAKLAESGTAIQQERAPTTDLGAPPVEFEPEELDFGYIIPNEDTAGEFAIRNVGDEPLTILSGKPTCACTTTTDVAGMVIQPGEFVTIQASLDGRANTGVRREGVRFVFEGYAQPVLYPLRGEITMPIRAAPSIFNLAGDQRRGHVVIESLDEQPFSVLSANGAPPVFVDFDPDLDEPRGRYVLEWNLEGVPDHELPAWWVIETDHPKCPLLDAWVRHPVNMDRNAMRPWYVRDRRFILGIVSPGSSHTIEATVENMPPGDTIRSVRSLSPYFQASLVDTERSGERVVCTLRLDLNRGLDGVFTGKIDFVGTIATSKMDVIGKAQE